MKDKLQRLVSHCVLCFRPFSWFFRRNWYALRWGIPGVDGIGKLWLVDMGAITIGWRDDWNARMRRNEKANAENAGFAALAAIACILLLGNLIT